MVVCDLSASPHLDLAGSHMLHELHSELAARGIALRIVGAHGGVRDLLRADGVGEKSGGSIGSIHSMASSAVTAASHTRLVRLLFAGLECELFGKAGVASARDAPSTLKPVKIDARTLIWIARVLTAIKVKLILTPDPVSEPMPDEKNDDLAADGQLKRKGYERELARLHTEFVKLQQWVVHKPLKVCIVFEGRDGAGKGGTIKAMTERVSPRIFRVVALPAPTEREKSQMYAQRYIPHLPAAGEVVIFDRSWYNRAGVERVMGFCTEDQVKQFLQMIPGVEKAIVESGIILLKYWLEVSPEEQTRRLEARIDDGRKTWKLSDMDLKSYSRWYDYSRARDEMFLATDTSWAPWYVVHSHNKRRARLNALTHVLSKIPYDELPRSKVKLPKRQDRGDYKETDYPFRLIPEVF